MKLKEFLPSRYRSLRHVALPLDSLNVLIGTNASGKSNILDALRFLSEGVRDKEFSTAVSVRGGFVHLAWKGEEADEIVLETRFEEEDQQITWFVSVQRRDYDFVVDERVEQKTTGRAPELLLESRSGKGWWWSAESDKRVPLALPSPTACSLTAASADASFPARELAAFVGGWSFFDPSPPLLRRTAFLDEGARLNGFGNNLAARLHAIKQADSKVFDRIVSATRAVLGVPEALEIRVSDSDQRTYFVQREPGLKFPVHQIGASSGTLRMLALMTALFGEAETTLVGIEEPENYVHPNALAAFAEHIKWATNRVQVLVTTHSPLLLNCLAAAEAVCIVRRGEQGTEVLREEHPEAIRKALDESGFGLGEFYETKGFGG
jgi:predicted ATPase